MKKWILFLIVFYPFILFSQNIQWNEDFADGDYTNNPTWEGMVDNFKVNADKQLQSNATATSKSYLSTPSEAFDNAEWEFWVRINYGPSANNYAIVYIASDNADLSGDLNGYYVQIGNTADEISLYKQTGSKKEKIIDGADKIIDANPVIVKVKVSRTKEGLFTLYRQRLMSGSFYDDGYVEEGSCEDIASSSCKYFGVMFANTTTTGNAYFFDDISVKGDKVLDVTPPEWISLTIEEPNKLVLAFSEAVDTSDAVFDLGEEIGSPVSIEQNASKTILTLTFSQFFESHKLYTLTVSGIVDLAGNPLPTTSKQAAIIGSVEPGDIVINEILFENGDSSPEYIEVFNRSDKIIDVTNLFYATRNSSGGFSVSNYFPKTIILPHGYMTITSDASSVREAYAVPDTANIVAVSKWSALNNTGANLLIGTLENGDTTLIDEVAYSSKWHHSLVKNTKGVALERISPEMNSQDAANWHSAASDVSFGTPGYKNSQYRSSETELVAAEKWFFPDPEAFSPDNDGIDDVCFIRYKTDAEGYTANIFIFNAVGVKVTQLASGQLLGSNGYFTWDGLTDRGLNVNPGIYVIYIELINIESGVKKIEKMPIVVSAR